MIPRQQASDTLLICIIDNKKYSFFWFFFSNALWLSLGNLATRCCKLWSIYRKGIVKLGFWDLLFHWFKYFGIIMVYTRIGPEIQGQNHLCIAHMFLMISLQHVVLELQNENNPWILIHLGRIVCTKTPNRSLLRKIIKTRRGYICLMNIKIIVWMI